MSKQPSSSLSSRIFGADLRSLAAFRIAIAAVCLYDLAERAVNLGPHYTDEGVVRRDDLLHSAEYWLQSFHFYTGTWWGEAVLFALAAAAAVCMLLGYRTWVATLVVYVLTISVQNRNPLIIHGADEALRVLLFWCLFLPLGARWSIDRLRAKDPQEPSDNRVLSGGTVALLFQISFIYFFAALLKTGEAWTNGDAVYYTLNAERYARASASWLLQFPELLPWATRSVYYAELLGPLLFFCPIFHAQVRLFAVGLFMSLHLGMHLFVAVGLWPWVMVAALLALLPSEFWNWLERQSAWRYQMDRIQVLIRETFGPVRPNHETLDPRGSWQSSAAALLLITYVAAWNIELLDPKQKLPDWHESVRWPGLVTGLDQKWMLFAPNPVIDDGWFVGEARLADGSVVDFLTGKPTTFDKPERAPMRSLNYRWQMLQKWLWQRRDEVGVHRSYARWVCADWLQKHGPEKAIVDYRLYYMVERTPPPGKKPPPIAKVLVFEYENRELQPDVTPRTVE